MVENPNDKYAELARSIKNSKIHGHVFAWIGLLIFAGTTVARYLFGIPPQDTMQLVILANYFLATFTLMVGVLGFVQSASRKSDLIILISLSDKDEKDRIKKLLNFNS